MTSTHSISAIFDYVDEERREVCDYPDSRFCRVAEYGVRPIGIVVELNEFEPACSASARSSPPEYPRRYSRVTEKRPTEHREVADDNRSPRENADLSKDIDASLLTPGWRRLCRPLLQGIIRSKVLAIDLPDLTGGNGAFSMSLASRYAAKSVASSVALVWRWSEKA